MRRLADPRANAKTARALANPRRAQGLTAFRLTIDGQERRTREIRYTAEDVREQDAPAMILDATVAGPMPPRTEGKRVFVDVYVDGVRWREFDGRVLRVEPTDDGDTRIEAYTSGYWLSLQEMGRETAWSGVTPRGGAYAALENSAHHRIDLSGIPERPKLYRIEPDVFSESAPRSELLGEIREQARCTVFDSPDDTAIGISLSVLQTPGPPDVFYEVGVDTLQNAFKPTPTFEGRYSKVLVYSITPEGTRQILKTFEVNNADVFVPGNVVYPIEVTTPSPEDLGAALDAGLDAANALSYGAWEVQDFSPLILDPRIVRGSTVSIKETKREGSSASRGRQDVTRRWLLRVSGYSRDPKNKVPTLSGACVMVSERAVLAKPSLKLRPSLDSAGIARPPYGSSPTGDYVYLDEALPWVNAQQRYVRLVDGPVSSAGSEQVIISG